jgi:DNA-binding transcriptional LysR family regulator
MQSMHSILRRIDLNLLPVFDAMRRLGSVSAAADELAMSPSALSHALGRLRAALGDELFIRQGNRMQATVRAEQLAAPVADALRTLALHVGPHAAFDPLHSDRTFVFSATDYTAFAVLPSLIARLQVLAPHLSIRVIYAAQKVSIDDLAAGRIDFALGYDEPRESLPAGVDAFDWLDDDYVVIARRHHPAIGRSLSLQSYLAARHVVVTPWNEIHGVVDHVLQARALQRTVAVYLPTVLASPFIIANSDLLMTLPRHAALALRRAAPVQLYRAPFPIPHYTLKVYCHSGYGHTPAHRWMRQVMADSAARPAQRQVARSIAKQV